MKKICFLIGIMLILSSFIVYGELNDLALNTVAYYKLEESGFEYVDEVSGQNLIYGTEFDQTTGKINYGQDCDASADEYIYTNYSTIFEKEDFTVTFWMNMDSSQSFNQVLVSNTYEASSTQKYGFTSNIQRNSGSNPDKLLFTTFNGIEQEEYLTDQTITPGQWYHVALWRGNDEIKVYLNGVETTATSHNVDNGDIAFSQGNHRLAFGSRDFWNGGWLLSGTTENFDGKVDEIAYFNKSLTLDEIKYLYNQGIPSEEQQWPYGLAECGNGIIEYSEECDDGNTNSDDGCSSKCEFEENYGCYDDVISHWTFNTDGTDATGRHNATLIGGPSFLSGQIGNSMNLQQLTYGRVPLHDDFNFGTEDFTLSSWIRTDWEPSGNYFFDFINIFNNFDVNIEGREGFILQLYQGRPTFKLATVLSNISQGIRVSEEDAINDDQWHHVVGVREGDQMKLYVDGVLMGTLNGTSDFNFNSTTDLLFGRQMDGYGDVYYTENAHFDEAVIFGKALNYDEVTNLYRRGYFGKSFCIENSCGNGLIGESETCDDGNTVSGDGCSSSCEVEANYECEGEPSVCVELNYLSLSTIAYYKLEESSFPYLDETSNEIDLINGNTPDQDSGVIDYGQQFIKSNNDRIYSANDELIEQSEFSISLWLKIDTNGVLHDIIDLANFDGSDYHGWYLRVKTDDTLEIVVYEGDYYYSSQWDTGAISTDTWYHVVFTWDGNHLKGYIDGELDGEEVDTHAEAGISWNPGTHDITLGSLNLVGSWLNTLDGNLDEVAYFSKALTEEEINFLYNNGNPGSNQQYPYTLPECEDLDNDSYDAVSGFCSTGDDCDDNNADVNPGAEEVCGNSVDDNCDGEINEDCPEWLWYDNSYIDNGSNPITPGDKLSDHYWVDIRNNDVGIYQEDDGIRYMNLTGQYINDAAVYYADISEGGDSITAEFKVRSVKDSSYDSMGLGFFKDSWPTTQGFTVLSYVDNIWKADSSTPCGCNNYAGNSCTANYNEWYDIVIEFHSSSLQWWVNGDFCGNCTDTCGKSNPDHIKIWASGDAVGDSHDGENHYQYVKVWKGTRDKKPEEPSYCPGSMLSYWNLDESSGTVASDYIDSSDGTVSGAAWTTGVINNGLLFDGSNDYVTIPDDDRFSFGDGSSDSPFSIAAYVKFDSSMYKQRIVGKSDAMNDGEWLLTTNGADKLALYLFDQSGGSSYIGRYWSTEPQSGVWYHVVATYDGSGSTSGIKVYVDGERVDDTSQSGGSYIAMENTDKPVKIGRYDTTYLDGGVDEVAIYNTELDENSVKELYINSKFYSNSYCIAYEPECGNNILDLNEECDDGNTNSGDGCSDICTVEVNAACEAKFGTPGMIAYWKADNDTTDYYADNDGSLAGDTSFTTGILSEAFDLDGNGDYVLVDGEYFSFGDGSNDEAFSVSAWVKFDNSLTKQRIVGKADSLNDGEWLLTTNGNNKLALYLIDQSGGNTYIGRYWSENLQTGNFYHVTATYDGSGSASGIKLFVNGERKDDTTQIGGSYVAMENTLKDVKIGSYGTTYLDGSVDEVAIFDRVLTETEINDLYSNVNSSLTYCD